MMDQCGDRFDMALQLLNDIKAGKYDQFDPNGNLTFEEDLKLRQAQAVTQLNSRKGSRSRSPLYNGHLKAQLGDQEHEKLHLILSSR